MGLLGGLFRKKRTPFEEAFKDYEMPKPERDGFWQGGEKMRGRDALAGALAAIGDAFSQQAGMQPGAIDALSQGRMDARAIAEKRAAEQTRMQQMIAVGQANGLTPQQVQAQALGLDLPKEDRPAIAQNTDYIRQQLGEEAATQYLRNYGDPMVSMTLPGDRFYSGPRSQLGQALGGGGVSSAPQPGFVKDGYRFKGGNPSDQNNWEPVAGGVGSNVGNGFRPY